MQLISKNVSSTVDWRVGMGAAAATSLTAMMVAVTRSSCSYSTTLSLRQACSTSRTHRHGWAAVYATHSALFRWC